MPECYLLAISSGSSLDNDTNNWSLFKLVEQVGVPHTPGILPLEIHTYWLFEPEEYKINFDIRLVLVNREGGRLESKSIVLSSQTPQHRVRITGLPIDGFGFHKLRVEWRKQDADQWEQCPIFWPLRVEQLHEKQQPSNEGTKE